MRYFLALPFFLAFVFSSNASAGWVCSSTSLYPAQCAAAANSPTAEQFAVVYLAAFDDSGLYKNYTPGACIADTPTRKTCSYTYTHGGILKNANFSVIGSNTIICEDTLESRGPDSSAIKSADKYYISWSVSSVSQDICHNSCSYLASSATVSTCYLNSGSTSSGFCNYVVGLDSSNSACNGEVGYQQPAVGDSLTVIIPSDPGGGDSGGDGGGNDGGTGGGAGDGSELGFTSPGQLDTKRFTNEGNAIKYNGFVSGMSSKYVQSTFGQSVEGFKRSINSAGGGTCPFAYVTIFSTPIFFDSHCALFESIAPVLSAVFLAAWSLLAFRIFMSA